jgi:hypothetical protein
MLSASARLLTLKGLLSAAAATVTLYVSRSLEAGLLA